MKCLNCGTQITVFSSRSRYFRATRFEQRCVSNHQTSKTGTGLRYGVGKETSFLGRVREVERFNFTPRQLCSVQSISSLVSRYRLNFTSFAGAGGARKLRKNGNVSAGLCVGQARSTCRPRRYDRPRTKAPPSGRPKRIKNRRLRRFTIGGPNDVSEIFIAPHRNRARDFTVRVISESENDTDARVAGRSRGLNEKKNIHEMCT